MSSASRSVKLKWIGHSTFIQWLSNNFSDTGIQSDTYRVSARILHRTTETPIPRILTPLRGQQGNVRSPTSRTRQVDKHKLRTMVGAQGNSDDEDECDVQYKRLFEDADKLVLRDITWNKGYYEDYRERLA